MTWSHKSEFGHLLQLFKDDHSSSELKNSLGTTEWSNQVEERVGRSRSRTPRSRSRSPASRSRSPPGRGRGDRNGHWVSISNLTRNVTLEHVKEIFGQYGEILKSDFPFNNKLNCNRGVSYLEFGDRSEAEKAIAHMDKGQLDGKVLVVVFGEPPRQRSPSPRPERRRRFLHRPTDVVRPRHPTDTAALLIITGADDIHDPDRHHHLVVEDDSRIPEVAAPAIHAVDLDHIVIVVVAAVVTIPEAVAEAILEVGAQAIHEAEAHRAADAKLSLTH
ncbi:hypothetical protein INT43_006254 [Umbelopsis isabellina]|uniref:RRM domain-containing protein n=1 Tax=Mortierella isabellina TaxID=91625 RepID=A0A8H7Q0F6_MORIS|nr:hypothetical protein INT43_006254 [Umbelopsis isabellina]